MYSFASSSEVLQGVFVWYSIDFPLLNALNLFETPSSNVLNNLVNIVQVWRRNKTKQSNSELDRNFGEQKDIFLQNSLVHCWVSSEGTKLVHENCLAVLTSLSAFWTCMRHQIFRQVYMTYCGSNIFLKDYSSYFFEVVHRTKLK